ncbi:MAG: hypothetical protein ABIW33_01550 [Sphingomicrobium sp.]
MTSKLKRARLTITLAAGATAIAGMATLPEPAAAQQNSVAEIIVFGSDPCPRSTDDRVVVCARRPETERYRLPKKYRPGGTRQETTAWGKKAQALETLGASGINSCSAVGPGGTSGCLTQVIKQARQERAEDKASDTPPGE